MVRRIVRIVCVAGVPLIVLAAVAAQFWNVEFDMRADYVLADPSGIKYVWGGSDGPGYLLHVIRHQPWFVVPAWSLTELFRMPSFHGGWVSGDWLLPWWLALVLWGILTAAVWRFTRVRIAARGSFPVEAAPRDAAPPKP